MKKLLLLLPVLCLSSQVLAKVSYEDAIESNRPYHDANGAVHIPPDITGLGPDEFDPDATESAEENEMGVWVYSNYYSTSYHATANRVKIGDSNSISQNALNGSPCLKGLEGYWNDPISGKYYHYTCK